MPRGRYRKSGYHNERSSACCACWKDPIYLVVSGIITCVIAGSLCITFGLLYQPSRKLVDNRLARRMSVTPHAPVLSEWTADRDANISYYFFNVTNPDEVMNGAIPNLEQVGPYIFTKRQIRYNTYWTKDQTEVLYDQNVTFIPVPHPGSLDPDAHNITTLNVPLLIFANVYKNPNLVNDTQAKLLRSILTLVFLFEDPLKAITSLEDLFIRKTPSELLWGYEDPVFVKIKAKAGSMQSVSETFGLQNNSTQKENLVMTGKNGTSLKGEFVHYNGLSEIDGWGTPTARMINGTDGTIFGAGINTTTNLMVFSDELQRSFLFTYNNDTSLHGIDCYRFIIDPESFSNTTDPGFYQNGPSGVFNASAVEEYFAPFYVSRPHFLDADPGYLKNVSGLKRLPPEQDYYIDVEPITGTTFRDNKTSQYNVLLLQYPDVDHFKNLRNLTMFPIFQSSETSMISEESSKTFRRIIFEAQVGTKIAISTLIAASGLVCIISALCTALFTPKAVNQCRGLHRRASMQYPPSQNGMGEKTSLLDPDRSINTS